MDEMEGSLHKLIKLASNAECVPSLIDGLGNCLQKIMTVVHEVGDNSSIDRLIMTLLNQIIQV